MAMLVALAIAIGACGNREVAAPVTDDPQVQAGYGLIVERSCTNCHSVDGSSAAGPTWQGLNGRTVTLIDGRTLTVDDAYLARALLDPDADVREGYAKGTMSSFLRSQDPLTTEQVDQMVAYLKTL